MELTRREFVAGLSASCFVCGCGGKASESEKPPVVAAEVDPSPVAESPKPEGELVELPCPLRAPGDQGRVTLADSTIVLVWRDRIGLHAIEGRCTHRRGQLFYDKDRNDIWCEEHGSRFFIDGAVAKPPAKVALKKYGVVEEGERLRITPRNS